MAVPCWLRTVDNRGMGQLREHILLKDVPLPVATNPYLPLAVSPRRGLTRLPLWKSQAHMAFGCLSGKSVAFQRRFHCGMGVQFHNYAGCSFLHSPLGLKRPNYSLGLDPSKCTHSEGESFKLEAAAADSDRGSSWATRGCVTQQAVEPLWVPAS